MARESLLATGTIIPSWTARDAAGHPFTLFKPRGQAHTLLVVAAPGADLHDYLAAFASSLADLAYLPARGVAVLGSYDRADQLAPWIVLTDDTGPVQRTYLPPGALAGMFILDRYNELYEQWIVDHLGNLPPIAEVAEWLERIGCDCGI